MQGASMNSSVHMLSEVVAGSMTTAGAVQLDAFLLRTIAVPALMHLSGRANWWLPGWLDRILPRLSIEPAAQPPVQALDRQRPHPQHAAR
jgi:uncharacterized membrane protein YdfJ with MMPL/SSD domain